MRLSLSLLAVASLCAIGCGVETTSEGPTMSGAPSASPAPAPAAPKSNTPAPEPAPAPGDSKATPTASTTTASPSSEAPPKAQPTMDSAATPVAVASGKATLSPENTKIGFIGAHTDNAMDRVGGFMQFTGSAEVDAATKTLKSASVEIQSDSIWTQFPMLTNHLKTPDFIDAREHPTIKFVTKTVTADSANPGQYSLAGDLTLHGVTKPVTFPAKVEISDKGLTLQGSFTIDRTEFGMDKMQERVKKEVAITVVIGKKTEGPPPGGGFGGRGGDRKKGAGKKQEPEKKS